MDVVYKIDENKEKKMLAEKEALEMVSKEITKDKTIHYLMESGYSSHEATNMVVKLERFNRKMKIKKAQTRMVRGGIFILAGLMITIFINHISANNFGFITAGMAILFGSIQFFKGLTLNFH